jgi:hypothetical protein
VAIVIIDEKTSKGKKLVEILKSFSDENLFQLKKNPNET